MSSSATPSLKTRVMVQPKRGFSNIVADVVLEESHSDDMVITQHPVEQGATISDHAYRKPAEVRLTYGWSMGSPQNTDGENINFLKDVYQELLQIKDQRIPFKVFTGKRVYSNMLIESLQVTTDRQTENFLHVRIVCKEVIIATTRTVQLDSTVQAMPSKTGADVNQGNVNLQPGTNFNGRTP